MLKLFVYGTLIKNATYLPGFVSKRKAWTKGKLYCVENKDFPALIPDGSQETKVFGMLIELQIKVGARDYFRALDQYEAAAGKDPLYFRKRIKVFTNPEKSVMAWAYVWNENNKYGFKIGGEIKNGKWRMG